MDGRSAVSGANLFPASRGYLRAESAVLRVLDDLLLGLVGERFEMPEWLRKYASSGVLHAVMAALELSGMYPNSLAAILVGDRWSGGVLAVAVKGSAGICGVKLAKTVTCEPQKAASYWPRGSGEAEALLVPAP